MPLTSTSLRWLSSHWFELCVFFTSFLLRFIVYSGSSFANGWDAYFYIVQIKSYIEDGEMHSSRLSLFYPLLIGCYYLVNDYELTFQLVSAIIVGLFSLQLYRTAHVLHPESDARYLVALFSLFSPQLTFVGAQFAKNLLGVVVLLLLLEYLLKKNYLRGLVAVVAGMFIHKMTAALSLLLVLSVPIARVQSRHLRYLFIGFLLIVGVLVVFPELLSFKLIDRSGFGFDKPVWPGMEFLVSINNSATVLWKIEVFATYALVSIVAVLVMLQREPRADWVVILTILTMLTFPLLEWSVLGLSYRLLMVFLIISPLLICYFRINLKTSVRLICVVVFTLGALYSASTYPAESLDPPYGKYKLLTKKIEELPGLELELLIVHKAFAEYYTFRTKRDALPWVPEYEIDPAKLWRVAYGVTPKVISYYSDSPVDIDSTLHVLSPWYLLVREDVWAACITRIEQEDPELFSEIASWRNPSEIRPAYLLKNKKD